MKNNDTIEKRNIISAFVILLGELYGRVMTKTAAKVYVEELVQIPNAQLYEALHRAKSEFDFMPSINQISKLAAGCEAAKDQIYQGRLSIMIKNKKAENTTPYNPKAKDLDKAIEAKAKEMPK